MKCLLFLVLFCSLAAEDALPQKLIRYQQVLLQKESLGKKRKDLAHEILAAMPKKGLIDTADFKAACKEKLVIRTSLEDARKLGATKMVEQVDKAKLRKLYLSGIPVKGIEKRSFLSFRQKKQQLR